MLNEPVDELGDEQRIPSCVPDRAHHVGRGLPAKQPRDEFHGAVVVQGNQAVHGRPVLQFGHERLKLEWPGHRPKGREDDEGNGRQTSAERADHQEQGRVRPMEILKDQQQRVLGRQDLDEVDDCGQHSELVHRPGDRLG